MNDQPIQPGSAPPTMEDVARVLGLHRTTVSLALRDHPRIPRATRERVREAADRLGYRPHPLVSALMSYRANHRKPTWRGTLGVITSAATANAWCTPKAYRIMYEGALARAHELGYDLQPFWAKDPATPINRFNTMLRTRNVPGVIVAPMSETCTLPPIEWEGLSAVAIGYTLQEPSLHRISNDYFHSMVMAVQQCLARGRRRIGLILDTVSDARVDHLWLSAFLMQQRIEPGMERIEPLLWEREKSEGRIRHWLHRERPDAIISLPGERICEQLQELGVRVPDEIAWVSLGCYEKGGSHSGVFQNYELIGKVAVEFLVAMIHRGERGIPEQRHTVQIKSLWEEGETLGPALSRGRKKRDC